MNRAQMTDNEWIAELQREADLDPSLTAPEPVELPSETRWSRFLADDNFVIESVGLDGTTMTQGAWVAFIRYCAIKRYQGEMNAAGVLGEFLLDQIFDYTEVANGNGH